MAFIIANFGYSERRACKLLNVDRTSYRYSSKPDGDEKLRHELILLAKEEPQCGYRRLKTLLEQRGWKVNHKHVYRIYSEELLGKRKVTRRIVD